MGGWIPLQNGQWDAQFQMPTAMVPQIKIGQTVNDAVPVWDGDGLTALQWFANVQEFAGAGGYIPYQLGYYLWSRLAEGSAVRSWFQILTPDWKAWMRRYYLNFLYGIEEFYLGATWRQDRHSEYTVQTFRQAGHARETPTKFLQRRLLYICMLFPHMLGAAEEVREVMKAAPVTWKNILASDQIQSVMTLQSRVVEMEAQLLAGYEHTTTPSISKDYLERLLRELGVETRGRRSRTAHVVDSGLLLEGSDDSLESRTIEFSDGFNDSPSVVECYASAKRRQRPPPKMGYKFAKRDDVVSSLRPPPSPCKCCGSEKHWDKECPHYHVWMKKYGQDREKSARSTEKNELDTFEDMYDNTFDELNTQASLTLYLDSRVKTARVANASVMEEVSAAKSQPRKARVEDVEEETESNSNGGFVSVYVLEQLGVDYDEPRRLGERINESQQGGTAQVNRTASAANSGRPTLEVTPNPVEQYSPCDPKEVHWLGPRRFRPSGTSALGVSVLSIPGRINDPTGEVVDLRLDSGADISLISAEYYSKLKKPPKLRKGRRMDLWQLTSKATKIDGYVELPLFIETESGEKVGLTAETYVVPDMNVPLLLGEDFHVAYELRVQRHVEFGTTVELGPTGLKVKAEGVRRPHYADIATDTSHLASYVRSKLHRRNKNRRKKARAVARRDATVARVLRDVKIPPNRSVNVPVSCPEIQGGTWLVERAMVGDDRIAPLVIPNVLIRTSESVIPVANTTNHPRMLRKGEALAELVDPGVFLDKPKSVAAWVEMSNASQRTAALIEATSLARDGPDGSTRVFLGREDGTFVAVARTTRAQVSTEAGSGEAEVILEEDTEESWGPKTAEVPDPTVYASEDLEKLIDVADVPEHLKPRIWDMLRRRIRAFGFDGRLGHLETKCRIRTKDGVEPVSVPMYASSPAKREVIDAQLATWFEQGVIEPSQSPWGAPVVIVYRNGKARFCVDYRKLNALTVPDEFPLPRQTEILSALSGAQVLSSLDALSGFTQIEIAEEDVEKTAFRTHRGLFQFRRMPFGLKNSPSIFQRTMQSILSPYLWLFTLVYIDDVVVYSKSYEEHLTHLDKVLEAIEKAGLTLSPKKCHLFYGSILLLGHKVSRLGLSTHEEKVRAITELQRPTKMSELQTFLGMVVYFSAFIPYYASIAAPLFKLLRKGAAWRWGPEEEHAFEAAKAALKSAPVLGHPIEGRPYRLYTDASDEAIGCCLQQVQPINVADLKGTKAYEKLQLAYEKGEPVPKLVTKLSTRIKDHEVDDKWGASLDSSSVHVERVLVYWSRTLKSAETRYSATEREALGAKEGLVKFQPYIEGEQILLITDHAALQWAKTYENANRRLAAWGAIYSAFAPGLEIIHRPGRVHSNVDPLSRLPRAPPEHTSPLTDGSEALRLDSPEAEAAEEEMEKAPARRAAAATTLEQWGEVLASTANERTRRSERLAKARTTEAPSATGDGGASIEAAPNADISEGQKTSGKLPHAPLEEDDKDPYETRLLWEATHRPPTVLVEMSEEARNRYTEGYLKDVTFRARWQTDSDKPESWDPANRFFKNDDGLLYFRDADFHARLCVPQSERNSVLRTAHESPYLTAHAGPEKLWEYLSSRYYWPRMKTDILEFCSSCDVCQKTKPSNFRKYGRLLPHSIPTRPYESISMDLIVNLPWSEDCNAILVFVDRFTKHAQFIPTTTGLNAKGFAMLFVKHVACKFGLPANIVTDRDPRWTSVFWREVAELLKTEMLLASSHHPQHDGQTEIVNRQLETMLRAYVREDRNSWCEWVHLLEHAYNSREHGATGATPYFLLYGFEPRSPVDVTESNVAAMDRSRETKDFLLELSMHRESARRAIARSQAKQANSFNKGRKPLDFEPGDLVLVNPHTLEWIESQGEGKKLVQRWIGPFEVQQRINANTYRLRLNSSYPGSPVFNIEHLKRYKSSPEEFGPRATLDDTRAAPADEVYEVESIVGHKYDKSKRAMKYLVRWKGYSPLYDEWKTAKELSGAPEILHKYRLTHHLRG